MMAEQIVSANHYEDGWLVAFKDHSGLRLWTDENGKDHVMVQRPDGDEEER